MRIQKGFAPVFIIIASVILLLIAGFILFEKGIYTLYMGHPPADENNPWAIREYTNQKSKLALQLPSYWGVCEADESTSYKLGQLVYDIGFPEQELRCGKSSEGAAYKILISIIEDAGGKDDLDLGELNGYLMKLYNEKGLEYELMEESSLITYSGKKAGRINFNYKDSDLSRKTIIKLDSGKDLYFIAIDYPGEWWDKFDSQPQEVHEQEINLMLNNLKFL